jgi:hypothetical protein
MSKIASGTLVVTSSPLFILSDFEASNMSTRETTYMYQKLIHQLYSFCIEPSFRVEGLGILAKNVLVTMDHPRIDAETGLKTH